MLIKVSTIKVRLVLYGKRPLLLIDAFIVYLSNSLIKSVRTFMTKSIKCLALFWLLLLTPLSQAEDTFGYFGMEPDIITNYISTKKKPGYVRVTIELMLKNADNIDVVEHHSPMLRDAIIGIIGREPEEKVKSLTGREEIRKKCADQVKLILKRETKDEIIHDLLFTKYLYH